MRMITAEDSVPFVQYLQKLMKADNQEITLCMMGDMPFLKVPLEDGQYIWVSVESEAEMLIGHHSVSYELPRATLD